MLRQISNRCQILRHIICRINDKNLFPTDGFFAQWISLLMLCSLFDIVIAHQGYGRSPKNDRASRFVKTAIVCDLCQLRVAGFLHSTVNLYSFLRLLGFLAK
jgi:hypothetical protein